MRLGDLLVFVVYAAPAVLLMSAFGLVAHTVRRLREGGRPRLASPRPFTHLAGITAGGAVLFLVYAQWTYASSFMPSDLCHEAVGGPYRYPDYQSTIPLSTVCGGVEIVPTWVNLVFFVLITGSLACLTGVFSLGVPSPVRRPRPAPRSSGRSRSGPGPALLDRGQPFPAEAFVERRRGGVPSPTMRRTAG